MAKYDITKEATEDPLIVRILHERMDYARHFSL